MPATTAFSVMVPGEGQHAVTARELTFFLAAHPQATITSDRSLIKAARALFRKFEGQPRNELGQFATEDSSWHANPPTPELPKTPRQNADATLANAPKMMGASEKQSTYAEQMRMKLVGQYYKDNPGYPKPGEAAIKTLIAEQPYAKTWLDANSAHKDVVTMAQEHEDFKTRVEQDRKELGDRQLGEQMDGFKRLSIPLRGTPEEVAQATKIRAAQIETAAKEIATKYHDPEKDNPELPQHDRAESGAVRDYVGRIINGRDDARRWITNRSVSLYDQGLAHVQGLPRYAKLTTKAARADMRKYSPEQSRGDDGRFSSMSDESPMARADAVLATAPKLNALSDAQLKYAENMREMSVRDYFAQHREENSPNMEVARQIVTNAGSAGQWLSEDKSPRDLTELANNALDSEKEGFAERHLGVLMTSGTIGEQLHGASPVLHGTYTEEQQANHIRSAQINEFSLYTAQHPDRSDTNSTRAHALYLVSSRTSAKEWIANADTPLYQQAKQHLAAEKNAHALALSMTTADLLKAARATLRKDASDDEARDENGRWTKDGSGGGAAKLGFDTAKWTSMPMGDRRDAWQKMSPEEQNKQADAAHVIPKSVGERLAGLPARPTSGTAAEAVSTRIDQINKAGLITPAASATLSAHMEQLTGTLRGMGVPETAARNLALDVVDHATAQEAESVGRVLGDHGIRHILGDSEMALATIAKIPGADTPENRAFLLVTGPYHDLGYLTDPSRNFLDMEHAQWGQQYFDSSLRGNVEAALGKDMAGRMSDLIGTHAATNLDWSGAPVESAFRLADNLALFQKEKLPALLAYVPSNVNALVEMGAGRADIDSTRATMLTNIDKEPGLSDSVREELRHAAGELTPALPKFTLGMLAGNVDSVSWNKDHVAVNIAEYSQPEVLSRVLDMGRNQFNKFAKTYGADPDNFMTQRQTSFANPNPPPSVLLEATISSVAKTARALALRMTTAELLRSVRATMKIS